jgi:hypothetical protein
VFTANYVTAQSTTLILGTTKNILFESHFFLALNLVIFDIRDRQKNVMVPIASGRISQVFLPVLFFFFFFIMPIRCSTVIKIVLSVLNSKLRFFKGGSLFLHPKGCEIISSGSLPLQSTRDIRHDKE